jgi:hypothetical protein
MTAENGANGPKISLNVPRKPPTGTATFDPSFIIEPKVFVLLIVIILIPY